MKRRHLWLLLLGMIVALFWALGIRLPMSDTAAALLALIVGAILYRIFGPDYRDRFDK